jgi:hypothetical protein
VHPSRLVQRSVCEVGETPRLTADLAHKFTMGGRQRAGPRGTRTSVRVPVPVGSLTDLTDLTVRVARETTVEEVNSLFRKADHRRVR